MERSLAPRPAPAALRRLRWRVRVEIRRAARSFRYRRWSTAGLPLIFGNSMAKSGSHILAQFLEGLATITPLVFTDAHPVRTQEPGGGYRTDETVVADLLRLQRGDMAWGYLPSRPVFFQELVRPGRVNYFVYRDPRDKIVSHILYALEIHPGHAMRGFYQDLSTMEARIEATIRGVPDLVGNIRETYESYLGWLDVPEVLSVRYEELIRDQRATVRRMLEHLTSAAPVLGGLAESAEATLVDALSPQRSLTFRAGQVGQWREHFTNANHRLFDEVAGDLLQRLGYQT